MHLLDNLHYNKACRDFCGGTIVIGHDPEGSLDIAARAERRKTTKIALITLLGKDGIDDEVWGSLNEEAHVEAPSYNARKSPKRARSSAVQHVVVRKSGSGGGLQSQTVEWRVDTKMAILFQEVAVNFGTPLHSLRFLLDGEYIDGNETIRTLELGDRDVIDCVQETTGC